MIESMVRRERKNNRSDPEDIPTAVDSSDSSMGNRQSTTPSKKHKPNVEVFNLLFSSGANQSAESDEGEESLDAEWRRYRSFKYENGADGIDRCLEWWGAHESDFPRVALGAQYALAVPSSSVSSRRVSLNAGSVPVKRRAKLAGRNVEMFVVSNDDMQRGREINF